ncbi:hypothetical protein GCM10008101_16810 [Lysobacter xinjiangensis]|uniref:NYN domain-containing protein n=1 Tax=Cognatilysobacter xinjiangensis TaxID=546892 RepID=A0ABQ3C0T7_9GAMM|nr:hypothetical protein [Lysobacter xinjiangensis]GGZ63895.1 hypothetical protein GCM10008101_16810 [Lysobacter xinjiangensis]
MHRAMSLFGPRTDGRSPGPGAGGTLGTPPGRAIGHISAREPGASFVIVSKDTGFDPLIRHLKDRGIACRRIADIPAPPGATPAIKAPPVAKKSKALTVVVLPEPNGAAAKSIRSRMSVH